MKPQYKVGEDAIQIEGLRYLAALAGPFCTMLLANMGDEVIKVELPWGDESMLSNGYVKLERQSSYFMFP